MKTWTIPVVWQMFGTVKIEADTLKEAMDIATDKDSVIPLPDISDYVDDSWELAYKDEDEIRDLFNEGRED